MFMRCKNLEDFSPIKNWNVSNSNTFVNMFSETKLADLSPMKDWNVSNSTTFNGIFGSCSK